LYFPSTNTRHFSGSSISDIFHWVCKINAKHIVLNISDFDAYFSSLSICLILLPQAAAADDQGGDEDEEGSGGGGGGGAANIGPPVDIPDVAPCLDESDPELKAKVRGPDHGDDDDCEEGRRGQINGFTRGQSMTSLSQWFVSPCFA
jgi:hypothetical protein